MSSKNQWYVRFDVKGGPDSDGTTSLGPMPIDAVISLAECGSILPKDFVREGRFGDWQRASEVPGVFDKGDRAIDRDDLSIDMDFESATEPSAPMKEVVVQMSPAPDEPPEQRRPEPPKSRKRRERSRNRSPRGRSKRRVREAESPQLDDEVQTDAEADGPVGTQDFFNELTRDEDPDPLANDVTSADLNEQMRSEMLDSIDASPSPVLDEIDPTPRVAPPPLPPIATVTPPRLPKLRPPELPTRRGSSGIGRLIVRLIVVLAVAGGGVLLIRWASSPNLDLMEASLVRLRDECRTLRSTGADSSQWNEFVSRAEGELDGYVPWLEETALPGERRKNLLLYAARDLAKMIAVAPDAEVPHQPRLDGFLQQLAEISGK